MRAMRAHHQLLHEVSQLISQARAAVLPHNAQHLPQQVHAHVPHFICTSGGLQLLLEAS
jgi:hypothetical protein